MTVRDARKQWKCRDCGSTELQVTAWITLNEGTVVDDEPPTTQMWCPDCGVDCADKVAVDPEHKPTRSLAHRECEHSECGQNYIDTGDTACIEGGE